MNRWLFLALGVVVGAFMGMHRANNVGYKGYVIGPGRFTGSQGRNSALGYNGDPIPSGA